MRRLWRRLQRRRRPPAFTVDKLGSSYAVVHRATYDAMVAAGAPPLADFVEIIEPRTGPPCRVYWGSHGCDLDRGHDGPHVCGCSVDYDGPGNVGAPPYYGPDTHFFGEDA